MPAKQPKWKRIGQVLTISLTVAGGGCVTWDDLTSESMWDDPVHTLFVHPEPMSVMRDPHATGDQLVKAMTRLDEPIRDGQSQADQDEAIKLLTETATSDHRALCRLTAIETLSRFEDPRVPEILISAFHHATPTPKNDTMRFVKLAGHTRPETRRPFTVGDGYDPNGFSPDVVVTLQVESLEALGKTRSSAALPLLKEMATQKITQDEEDDPLASPASRFSPQQQREVKMAAVRALGNYPAEQQAAETLLTVLREEEDVALRDRAHEGLVEVTGYDLPPQPKEWESVLNSKKPLTPPEPSLIRQVSHWFTD